MTVALDLPTPTDLGLDPDLEASGFNVAGVLAAPRYDALVPPAWASGVLLPQARSAVVLGCGGRAFGEAFARSPADDREAHPLDRFGARVVESAARRLCDAGTPARALFYWERRDGTTADFVALARACGLGSPSRLGILLHPGYGPWLSLRAVLLSAAPLDPTRERPDFAPCDGCPAPCADACPGEALAREDFDLDACAATTRTTPACRAGCAARRACVFGRAHRYAPDLERRHRAAALAALGIDPKSAGPEARPR